MLRTVQKELLSVAVDRRDNFKSLLPVLRLETRLLVPEDNAAERLVERMLEPAVKNIDRRPEGLPLAAWLYRILTEAVRSVRRSVLN